MKSLGDENLRLQDLLASPEKLNLEVDKVKGAVCEVQHWAVKILAASLADSIGEAPNFVTGEITVNTEQGPLIFTLQRKWGKSPAEVLGELQARIAELEQERQS